MSATRSLLMCTNVPIRLRSNSMPPTQLVPPKGACVLVTAAGTATSYGWLRSLRDRWGEQVRLVATDTNQPQEIAASTIVDRSVQAPSSTSSDFHPFIEDLIAGEGVTVYCPVIDHEIMTAAEMRDSRTLSATVAICVPDSHTATLCVDKLAMADWLTEHGFPTPKTSLVENAEWDGRALLAKPRQGFGSRGVSVIGSRRDLDVLEAGDVVVQDLCEGPEVTVDVFRSTGGKVARALCRERLAVRGGVVTTARIFEDPYIGKLALDLAAALEMEGVFCLQVMRGSTDSEWQITDVNARPGGGTRMSCVLGVDFHCAWLSDIWGGEAGALLPRLERERLVVRRWEEEVR